MTKREFLDIVFALAPNEANAIMDAFDEYVESNEPHWIAVRKEDIDEQPTIQPEIVRCKDCKHWIPYDWMFSEIWQSKNIADYTEDDIGCDCSETAMKANDFCSRGERREATE